MSDHERGAYTPPTEGPLAFEPRQPVRGARPFPLTLVVSVLVLLGLAAAIFVFYRSGVRQASGPPQPVGAPVGGLKSAPPPESQPQEGADGLQIYRSEAGQPAQAGAPKFTAPPEQPQTRPEPGPPVTLVPPQQGAVRAPPPAAPVAQSTLRPAQAAAPPASAALPPAKTAIPGPSVVTPPAKAAPTTAAHEALAPDKPKATPTDKPKTQPAKAVAAKPATKPEPKTETPKPAAVAKGAAVVQIGAVSSPALADKTWNEAVAVAPGLAVGKGKAVEKVEKDGKTLYRTAVTGFASREAAQAFCAKLKAAGKACFVR